MNATVQVRGLLALFVILGYPGPPGTQADAPLPVFSATQFVLVAVPAASP